MNNHSTVQNLLSAYALGELNQKDALQVEVGLAECDSCRDQLAQMRAVLNIADSMKTQTASDQTHNLATQKLQVASEKAKTEASKQISWSRIMKSNITKSAAAAMILIGAFIFLTQTNGTGLVLANVIEKFSLPYQCRQTVYYGGKEHRVTTLYRLNLSQRREERPNNEVFIVDMRQTPIRTLYLYENEKFAKVMNDYARGPLNDPDLIQMLGNMETGNAEKLGVQTTDGVQAEGFRTVSKYNDITIWGDVETGLPAKVIITHPQQDRKIVFENFQFDVAFDPSLFSTDPPEGYQVHEVSLNQETSDTQTGKTDESLPQSSDGAEAFIPHSCIQTIYQNNKELYKARIFHKTLSLRREEHFDDGSIHIVDITEKPAIVLRMETDTKKATLKTLYNAGGVKNPDMLAMLARMRQGDSEKIGVQFIDGIEAEGFRTVSPYNDITIWADIKTGLPVKIEVVHPKAKQRIVMDDFDFEGNFDDSLFSLEPPEGFEVKEDIVGLKLKAEAVTKDQIQSPGYPVYVLSGHLSWTLESTMIEGNVPGADDQKLHVVAATSKDGRHLALAQCSVYNVLKEKIQGGNKCLQLNGFTVWNGGPESWYSKIALESAQDMIPPGISEDRTGYAIQTPQGSIIIVGINGALTDAELKELVESLELVDPEVQ